MKLPPLKLPPLGWNRQTPADFIVFLRLKSWNKLGI